MASTKDTGSRYLDLHGMHGIAHRKIHALGLFASRRARGALFIGSVRELVVYA